MATLIDSSVLISAERGRVDLDGVLRLRGGEAVAIAAITASELLHGVARATDATIRTRRRAFVERLMGAIPVVPFDLPVARVHAELWARLAARGISIGTHDLLIGATAIAHGFHVATRDERSFPRISGLKIIRW